MILEKGTLWDKRLSDEDNPRMYSNDVKEALKEFINYIENNNNVELIKRKAKEIFGEELLE